MKVQLTETENRKHFSSRINAMAHCQTFVGYGIVLDFDDMHYKAAKEKSESPMLTKIFY